MRLKNLLEYDDIVIQCHDNPDADTIACGFALYVYLKEHGKDPRLIYGGGNLIRKSNLVMIVEDLGIPIRHVTELEAPELLVMVDCQYQGGNTTVFPARNVAVIDHHRVSTDLPELSIVRSNLGACSTLMWKLLKEEGFDVENHREVVTALYYGLYTDTGSLHEIVHPLDKDLRDEAQFDTVLMTKYRNSNLSLEELEVAGAALLKSDYMEAYRAAIVKSGPCDPNILGIISDLVLEVDAIDICVVFNVQPGGVKISVRSCIKEVMANELAEELCAGIGSGGGHLVKAGGFIQMDLLTKEYKEFCRMHRFTPRMEYDGKNCWEQPSVSGIKAVIEERFCNYMDDTDFRYAKECRLDMQNAQGFCRRQIAWGYVRLNELIPDGTKVTVRTMQRDVHTVIQPDTVMQIAPGGEVYLRSTKELEEQYRIYPDWKFSLKETDYEPMIKNTETGELVAPLDSAVVCVPNGEKVIYAQRLTRKMKLFREGEQSHPYTLGRVGDYLINSGDMLDDVRIMKKESFEEIYQKADTAGKRKSVIFDLDGTLLYTLEDLKEAVNAALRQFDMPVCTLEQVCQYVGNGVRKLMIRAVPEGEENPRFEEVFAAFKEYYGQHCLDSTAPYPGVLGLLKELKVRGVQTAIVSNKLDSAVKELTERFFGGYIKTAIGEMEGVERKPAPDMVNKALEALGAERDETIYVGDSEVDIRTAQNAGLFCVSVTWGFREAPFLRSHGAKTLIQTPLELLNFL